MKKAEQLIRKRGSVKMYKKNGATIDKVGDETYCRFDDGSLIIVVGDKKHGYDTEAEAQKEYLDRHLL